MSSRRSIQSHGNIDSSSFRRSAKLELRSALAVFADGFCNTGLQERVSFWSKDWRGRTIFLTQKTSCTGRSSERGSTVVQACNRVFTPMEGRKLSCPRFQRSLSGRKGLGRLPEFLSVGVFVNLDHLG